MALSLTAEQQSIFDMFSGKNQYIIPPYQRAYSWGEAECKELFEDLKNAYYSKSKDGYFLGNIVISGSLEDRNRLEIIDGQQRITTLTLLMKVLSKFDDTSNDLKDAIYIPAGRQGDISKRRLETNVFIKQDAQSLKDAIELELNTQNCKITKKESQFKQNICFFYNEIEIFSKINEIKDFIDFFLYEVTLLPIQTEDSDADKAREKALKIFETINDRGLSLTDSDIFKAKLYSNARNNLKDKDFIKKWNIFDEDCMDIKNHISFKQKKPIDEVFRTYTYIIRGDKGDKSNEISLRAFFLQKNDSPLKKMNYDEVLTDLSQIIEAIQFFGDVIRNPHKYQELTKWFQLINVHTNKYPLNILLVYLYKNGLNITEDLKSFSRELVKFAYRAGITIDKMKKFMFDSSIKIMHNKDLNFSIKLDNEQLYSYSGSLRKGLSLLSLYLNPKQESIEPYYFDKIIQSKDIENLDESWSDKDFDDYKERIGNILILDFPKKNIILEKKIEYLKTSSMSETKQLLPT
ncbi:MAG: DUF262 domain-containing protein, partial [Sulfurovum sp.]